MYLFIYINTENNLIIKLSPNDSPIEFNIGNIINLDNKNYSVISIITEEFNDFELITYRVELKEITEEEYSEYT